MSIPYHARLKLQKKKMPQEQNPHCMWLGYIIDDPDLCEDEIINT